MIFLPTDYKVPSSSGNYMKFNPGENRFRIMSSPILGYEYWKEIDGKRKPIRVPMEAQISPDDLDPDDNKIKHFWAMVVFDHADSKIKILEITQKSILRTIRGLSDDEDWGDPKGSRGYDIVVVRTGEGLETRYEVNPKPKKKLTSGIQEMYDEMDINLKALFKGEDPFASEAERLADDASEALGV